MTAQPDRTLRRALTFARRGWPVFPCQPGSKRPATRHGFKDASTSQDQIRRWWQRSPAANLAIATGAPGPDVLDVDQHGPAGNGFAAYDVLKESGLLDGAVAVVSTPSGGLHAYFTGSTQPSARLPRQHLDFKATGGYVLAPPSTVGGKPYRLIARRDPEHCGLDWPTVTQLLEPEHHAQLRDRPADPGDISRLAAWVERLPVGNRNSGLFWAACRVIEAGGTSHLDQLAAAAASAGLGDSEIARTIASACLSGQRGSQPAATPEISR
jgi:hypothetical protein